MSDVSRTSPHCVHTASPREGSTSIDVEPHDEHLGTDDEDAEDADAPDVEGAADADAIAG